MAIGFRGLARGFTLVLTALHSPGLANESEPAGGLAVSLVMRNLFRQSWQGLTTGRPGRRFEERYEAARDSRQNGDWRQRLTRLLRLVLALVFLVVGVVLVFIPGPAIVFFFLSGSLLAAESRRVARMLDWVEVWLRARWKQGKSYWTELPRWGRLILLVLVACLGIAGAYASSRLLTS